MLNPTGPNVVITTTVHTPPSSGACASPPARLLFPNRLRASKKQRKQKWKRKRTQRQWRKEAIPAGMSVLDYLNAELDALLALQEH